MSPDDKWNNDRVNIKYDGFFIKDKNLKQVLFLFGLICMYIPAFV